MAGDYPSTDFAISEQGGVRQVIHLPSGIVIETVQVSGNSVAVSQVFKIEADAGSAAVYPDEVAQAALRHLRVWLIGKYGVPLGRVRGAAPRPGWWPFPLRRSQIGPSLAGPRVVARLRP